MWNWNFKGKGGKGGEDAWRGKEVRCLCFISCFCFLEIIHPQTENLFTRVISKLKRISSKNAKNHNSTLRDFPSPTSSIYKEGRLYSMNKDDRYWRISFRDDRISFSEEEITASPASSHRSGAAEEGNHRIAANPEGLRKESSNWRRIPANRGRI